MSDSILEELNKAKSDLSLAEKQQTTMKEVNAIIRSKKDVLNRIIALGISEETANKIILPDFANRTGFPQYKLTNNNANIKRLQERVTMLEKKWEGAKSDKKEEYTFDGGTFLVNYEIDRVQILYDGKPDSDVRTQLKRNGWNWSPSNGAWQRKITPQAISNAIYLTKATKGEGETTVSQLKPFVIDQIDRRNFSYVSGNGYALKEEIGDMPGSNNLTFICVVGTDIGAEAKKAVKDLFEQIAPNFDVEKLSLSVYPKTYVREAKQLFEEGRFIPGGNPLKIFAPMIQVLNFAEQVKNEVPAELIEEKQPAQKNTKAGEVAQVIREFCEQSDLPMPQLEFANKGNTVYLKWEDYQIEAIIDIGSPVEDGLLLKKNGLLVENFKPSRIREVFLKLKELFKKEIDKPLAEEIQPFNGINDIPKNIQLAAEIVNQIGPSLSDAGDEDRKSYYAAIKEIREAGYDMQLGQLLKKEKPETSYNVSEVENTASALRNSNDLYKAAVELEKGNKLADLEKFKKEIVELKKPKSLLKTERLKRENDLRIAEKRLKQIENDIAQMSDDDYFSLSNAKAYPEVAIKNIANAYHQAISVGNNPELIKAVEESISNSPFKGIDFEYKNQYLLNKAIEALLTEKGTNHEDYSSDEKSFIRKYSGYGGLDQYGKTGKGGLFEYYTPQNIIAKMWALAYKYGYNNGPVLEPSVATGEFLQFAKQNIRVVGYEISEWSAKICRILYPTAEIILQPFEQTFIKNNYTIKDKLEDLEKFDLVIGNPPYGDFSIVESRYMSGMGEKDHVKPRNYVEYFIRRGVDLLKKDGLLIYIVGSQVKAGGIMFLDSGPSVVKDYLNENVELLEAYRLPNSVFERTGVTSDIIVLKKTK